MVFVAQFSKEDFLKNLSQKSTIYGHMFFQNLKQLLLRMVVVDFPTTTMKTPNPVMVEKNRKMITIPTKTQLHLHHHQLHLVVVVVQVRVNDVVVVVEMIVVPKLVKIMREVVVVVNVVEDVVVVEMEDVLQKLMLKS